MTALTKMSLLAGATLIGHIGPTYAQAESGAGAPAWPSFQANSTLIGRATNMGPDCPFIEFHVVSGGRNQLQGIAFQPPSGNQPADAMRAFHVTGTIMDDGKVSMDLKPLSGGAAAKVEGTFKNGMLMASFSGAGSCHSTNFMMMPVAGPASGKAV